MGIYKTFRQLRLDPKIEKKLEDTVSKIENRQPTRRYMDSERPKEKLEQPRNLGVESKIKKYEDSERPKNNIEQPKKNTDYSRPTHWPAGFKDKVWEKAKDAHGRVRDPVTGRYMSKDQAWDVGHKPGYEFKKHQESAEKRGIDRETFLKEYFNPDHFRPELPSSNRSHKGENKTNEYFGD